MQNVKIKKKKKKNGGNSVANPILLNINKCSQIIIRDQFAEVAEVNCSLKLYKF